MNECKFKDTNAAMLLEIELIVQAITGSTAEGGEMENSSTNDTAQRNDNSDVAISDGQMPAITDADSAASSPPLNKPQSAQSALAALRARGDTGLASHCLWPAVAVSGTETAELQFRNRPKNKGSDSKLMPAARDSKAITAVQAAVTAPAGSAVAIAPVRLPSESASATGVFKRSPSGTMATALPGVGSGSIPGIGSGVRPGAGSGVNPAVNPGVGSGSRNAIPAAAKSATTLQQASTKRRDPRATNVFQPYVKPETKLQKFVRTWMRRVMYATVVVAVVTVVGLGCSLVLQNARSEEAAVDKKIEHSLDMAEVLNRMSKLESECSSQRALIHQQEMELKKMQTELNAYARSSTTVMQRLNTAKAP